MPTLIDELVITLGLDPSDFNKGQKQVADGLVKSREAADTTAKRIEASSKQAGISIGNLRNEVVGLFLVLSGGKGLAAFGTSILENDAHVGRLSKSIGVATDKIGAWQAAVKEMGGSSGDADSALGTMSKVLSDTKLGLRPDNAGVLQALGINQDTSKDPSQMLMRIAQASQTMDPTVFNNLASRLGFSPEFIALLERGSSDLNANMPRWQKMANITQGNARAAADYQSALADLQTTMEGDAQPAVAWLAKTFADLSKSEDGAKTVGEGALAVIGAVGIAAGIAYAPVAALAGVLLVAAKAFEEFSQANAGSRRNRSWDEDKKLLGDIWAAFHKGGGKATADALAHAFQNDKWTEFGTPIGGALAGGGLPAAGRSPSAGGNREQITSFFKANGFTDAQSQGIWASIMAESNGNPNALGPRTAKGHRAYGIGQWLSPDRIADFQRVMGRSLQGFTLDQQLSFMLWEMRNTHKGAGTAIASDSTSRAALIDSIRRLYKPGNGAAGDYARGLGVLGLPRASMLSGGSQITFGNIIVNNPTGDPHAAGAAVARSIRRNLRGVQADGAFN